MTTEFIFTSELMAQQAVQTCYGLQSWATLEELGNNRFKVVCSELFSGVIKARFNNYII